jgi:ABC-type uncharacterized transport system involved in gliding motility auxiliary subunit
MPDTNRRKRVWVYGSNTLISTLFFLGILVFIALIAQRHPWRVDLSESGTFSLSEQTRKILQSIDAPIQIKAFFASTSPEQPKVQDLLETYRYQNKNISYEFIDPDRQPEIARNYEIRNYGTLVVEGFERRQTVPTADESGITNALLKLSRSEDKKVYFLVGHGERSLDDVEKDGYSSVHSALETENYVVAELNLLQQERVPEDASLVIVAGPRKPLFEHEVAALRSYLHGGGKLMVFLDPEFDGGLKEFLLAHGVKINDDIVIDKLSRLFGGSYLMPVVMQYGEHKITDNFGTATFFAESRSVEATEEIPEGIEVEVLASTSENAWGETNLELLRQKSEVGLDENEDLPGPVPLLVIARVDIQKVAEPKGENNEDSKEVNGQLLVGGDSDFLNNTYFALSGNGDLFLNMVNFLAEEEHLITIEARAKSGRPLLLTQNQARAMSLVLFLMPLLVVLSGLMVYRVRRSQR